MCVYVCVLFYVMLWIMTFIYGDKWLQGQWEKQACVKYQPCVLSRSDFYISGSPPKVTTESDTLPGRDHISHTHLYNPVSGTTLAQEVLISG